MLGHRLKNLDEDLISEDKEDEGSYEDEEMDRDCPTIRLSKEEKVRIQLPWKKTLIIKLLGRSIGYNLLLRKINDLWRPRASIALVALHNGFFIAKFAYEDDYNYAKFEGAWMIFNHYLIVQQWQPNFDPNYNSLRSLMVGVRLPCLPIEYFDYKFLMRVGSKIGKPIRVANATSTLSIGHYERICVEVDVLKPLVSKFRLKRRIKKLEYGGYA